MTIKKAATLLEKRFKGDIFLNINTIDQFIKEEIKPITFKTIDLSLQQNTRLFKVIIELKKLKKPRYFEIFIKP